MNESSGDEDCVRRQSVPLEAICPWAWDGLLCWAPAPAGHLATQPCLPELNGIRYDPLGEARRHCLPDGRWDNYTNYSDCQAVLLDAEENGASASSTMLLASWIYLAGYTISLMALCLAISIFLCFKELRCLRNTIHTHLMTTYVLADALWVMAVAFKAVSGRSDTVTCIVFVLIHYFHLTNLFWMLVEGLYLYVLVVRTFSVDNIPLRIYLGVGWGIPLLLVLAWAVAKAMSGDVGGVVVMEKKWEPDLKEVLVEEVESWSSRCPWLHESPMDWLFKAPALVVLALNMTFLVLLMRVLVTKLRSGCGAGAGTPGGRQQHHQQSQLHQQQLQSQRRQSHKAAKALLVLMPLLGANYVLLLVGPDQGPLAHAFAATRAFLLASQGFLVALLYCFLNAEVGHVVRQRWGRWRAVRGALGTLGPLGSLRQRSGGRGGPGATQALLSRGRSTRRSLLRSRSLCIRLNPLSVSKALPATPSKTPATPRRPPGGRPRTSSASEATLSSVVGAASVVLAAAGRRSPEDSSQDAAL